MIKMIKNLFLLCVACGPTAIRGCSRKTSVVRGRGRLSCADILRTREEEGSTDEDVCTFWYKNIGFFEIYGIFARTREEGD